MVQYSNMKGGKDGERDKDEDLSLFKELRKRHNELISSLLQSASEDYEHDSNGGGSGRFPFYRIPSGKKEHGLEFMVETSKNDYDWLKTPPTTPLFPSLEMEPIAQLVQREIPISQPISRFAGSDSEASKPKVIDGKANHNNSSSKTKLPMRSITPSHNRQRPSIIKNRNEQQQQQLVTPPATITNKTNNNAKTEHVGFSNTKSTQQKQINNTDFLALNLKKSMESNESQRKPMTRGISPSVKSRVSELSNMVELSDVTPPNLRIDERSSSTTRGRSTTRASKVVGVQKPDPTPKTCRPSRSQSPNVSNGGNWNQLDRNKNLKSQKERFTLATGTYNESRAHFIGSKMVEKVVNARKPGINHAERETQPKPLKYR